jgi:hypothetical protein
MGRLAPAFGFLVAIVAIAVIFGVLSSDRSTTPSNAIIEQFLVNEPVKAVTVQDKDARSVELDQQLSDKTLVTFWDATCAECRIALPLIASFVAAHPEVSPIYINVKDTREQAETALKELNLAIETYYDSTGAAQAEWSGTMPATYYIRNGSFRVFFPGRPSADHLNALLTLN